MGSILADYEPERSHMDLIRTIFHDFLPKLASRSQVGDLSLVCCQDVGSGSQVGDLSSGCCQDLGSGNQVGDLSVVFGTVFRTVFRTIFRAMF